MPEQRLEFASASGMVPPGTIQLRRLHGREELARPYEYELEIEVDEDGGLSVDELEDLMRQPCLVRFGADGQTEVHGIIRAFEMSSTAQPQPIVYRAHLVPKLWLLSQVRRSRIFQDLDVPGIVRAALSEMGLEEDDHFEVRLTGIVSGVRVHRAVSGDRSPISSTA